uniref:ZP domain-containing protein n=1 Tax=Scophthalmus maximus TaxID=52904 RepID=A0A8D3C4E4_SCOMX
CMIQSLCRWFVLLVAVAHIEAQKKPPIDNSAFLLTPSLASQCGFSVKTDQLGNAMIFASLHNCFAQNVGDALTTTLNLRLHGNRMAEDELYRVAETCHYADWSSREIVCERNYIEVSVKRAAPDDYVLPANPLLGANTKFGDPRRAAEKQPVDTGFRITSLVFFTPEEKMMTVTEARRRGHGIANTPSRLVLRSPQTSPETYTQNVAGVPMTVLQTSTIFEKKWLATRINAAAACPTVSFTPNHITWYLPRHIDPLISSGQFKLLEMAARRYSLSATDMYVVVEIPIGAAGGHFKSHVQDGQYLTSYTIEPMLELLWTEETTHEDTRYKVLFPITTPLLSRPAQVTDNTVPEEQIFKVLLGPFGSDVALMNVTFPHEVLSVADCSVRGFNVLEHMSPNSGSKVYTLEVPFTDPVVLQMKEMDITVYSLHMTFGLLVLPEFAPFAHAAYLEARVVEIVAPSVTGGCDHQNFNVLVKYGSQGFNFQATVGKQMLTPSLAQQYGVMENHTHLSFAVPFTAPDVAFEAVESSSIRSRLDVVLRNLETNKNIKEFSLACNFASFLTECFPNGTMTALAVKLESVPSLDPGRLTLRDSTCGPAYSDGRYAYFVFTEMFCDFPVVKYLQQPLYFEVELMKATNPRLSLELGNCWATLYDDGMSKPRWNLIIDGCPNPRDPNQVVFHPVWVDARVQYPSHVKRFEVQMFAFAEDQDNLHRQLFVHCDVMICDDRNPLGGVCNGQCSSQENRIKGQRRAVSDKQSFKHVSSGAILIS